MNTSNAGRMFRHVMPKASYLVSRQDSSMTSPQSPRYMRDTDRKDLHSKFDQPGQRYRMLMMDLANRQAAGDFDHRDNVSADCSDIIGLRSELFRYCSYVDPISKAGVMTAFFYHLRSEL